MGLQKQIELDTGIVCENAYHRITSLVIDYINQIIRIDVSTYYNEQSRIDVKLPIRVTTETTTDEGFFAEGIDLRAVAYEYLKTLLAYEGALDV